MTATEIKHTCKSTQVHQRGGCHQPSCFRHCG